MNNGIRIAASPTRGYPTSISGLVIGIALIFSLQGCQSMAKLTRQDSGHQGGGSLTVLPSSAVVVAEGSRVASYQPDGAVGWSFVLPEGEQVVAPPVAALSSVTYVRGEQTLFAIAPDGVALWQSRHSGAGDTIRGITPLGDSTVAITQDDRSLVAFTDRGQIRWTFALPDEERLIATPAIAANSLV
ncbi:MAG: hypothetical protein EBU88_08520, partial [Acidobacteria bacterium]|nr:hypothetical protein [Acidobacteriota bacterium]